MSYKHNDANYKFFQHKQCEFFPCHKINDSNEFNCLFCYCPLYMLKERCGGNFKYTENGIKDCSKCTVPHGKYGYDHVMSKMIDVMRTSKKDK